MEIRAARDADWPGIWAIVTEVLAEGDAYTYDPDMTEDEARDKWLGPAPWSTSVTVDSDRVLGAATYGPNQAGPGSHICNANFIVAKTSRGGGFGTALVEDTLARARADGYAGMQFNAVVETNPAVALYERVGFDIIGTVPGAFRHPRLGPVGLHVMYLAF
ncbi:N-acetyltransferase family protein [Aeromicrobium sp.]|uniref:GNAT family N-acetyltransferase n=1 Tax=Aeromicrobium sp. TaxID=1871063 RepID=UPI003D6BB083